MVGLGGGSRASSEADTKHIQQRFSSSSGREVVVGLVVRVGEEERGAERGIVMEAWESRVVELVGVV